MEQSLLQALHLDPTDDTGWLALADWLEENGRVAQAEALRLRETLRKSIDVEDRPEKEERLRALIEDGESPPSALVHLDLAHNVPLTVALVPPGVFLMGSPDEEKDRYENESPRHSVTITRPFYLGIYPVTQRQWRARMGDNPSQFRGDARPVESVSWPECQSFCEDVAEKLGRPCRLPTEAEWEYACRAGTSTAFHTGEGHKAMRKAGWCSYRGNSGSARETKPVGMFLPNAFGLYDMHGGVREWCLDDLRRYTKKAQIDPRGGETGSYRVVRGGSWYYSAEDSRAACRYSRPVDYHLDYYGFRVLLPCA